MDADSTEQQTAFVALIITVVCTDLLHQHTRAIRIPPQTCPNALLSSSGLYGVLWPIIAKQASWNDRRTLRNVNHYFIGFCHDRRRSDRAKSVSLTEIPLNYLG